MAQVESTRAGEVSRVGGYRLPRPEPGVTTRQQSPTLEPSLGMGWPSMAEPEVNPVTERRWKDRLRRLDERVDLFYHQLDEALKSTTDPIIVKAKAELYNHKIHLHSEHRQRLLEEGPTNGKPPSDDLSFLLGTEAAEPRWQIRGLWERGDVVVLGGNAGHGKSFIALHLMLSLAVGSPLFGGFPIAEPGRTAYLDAEMSAARSRRRLRRLVEGMDADPMELVDRGRIIRCRYPLETREGLEHALDDLVPYSYDGLDLVVLDTLRRFYSGKEQDSGGISSFYANLDSLREHLGNPTILIPHHLRKRSKEDAGDVADLLRGSTDILDGCDCAFVIESKTEDGVVRLVNVKSREEEIRPIHVRFAGWQSGTESGEKWREPLRLELVKDPLADLAQFHDAQTAVLAWLEARPGQGACRSDIMSASPGGFTERKIGEALKTLWDQRRIGKRPEGNKTVYYVIEPERQLLEDEPE